MATKKDSTHGAQQTPGAGDHDGLHPSNPRRIAWWVFLDAVNTEVPGVLETLAHDVAPLYEAFHSRLPVDDYARFLWREGEARRADADAEFPALRGWADHWHLNVDVVRLTALETLDHWWWRAHKDGAPHPSAALSAEDLVRFGWEHLGWSPAGLPTDEEMRFAPRLPPYDPSRQPRREAERTITAAFKAQLTAHMDRMDGIMQSRGWPPKWKAHTPEHFAWLVWYQVEELTYAQVASRVQERAAMAHGGDHAAYPTQGIKAEIARKAHYLGISLRGTPGPRPRTRPHRPRGRPPGSANVVRT